MPKKIIFPLIGIAILALTVVAAVVILKNKKPAESDTTSKRQIINAIPIPDRPFVTLFPHQTGKLITLYADKLGSSPELSIDLEYLAGNSLKGGRTTISSANNFPYSQAFLLGSCSSGGKCSFDTDITTGSIKTKIEGQNEINVLRSNFVFVEGRSSTSDQKLVFEPSSKLVGDYILAQTHGFLGQLSLEPAAEPVVVTADVDDDIIGTLTIYAPDATGAVIYNGEEYLELDVTKLENNLVIELDHQPWSTKVSIIRDDLKGASEDTTLYLIGPIIPVK